MLDEWLNSSESCGYQFGQIICPFVGSDSAHAEDEADKLFELSDQQNQGDALHVEDFDAEEGTGQAYQPFQTGVEELDDLRVAA